MRHAGTVAVFSDEAGGGWAKAKHFAVSKLAVKCVIWMDHNVVCTSSWGGKVATWDCGTGLFVSKKQKSNEANDAFFLQDRVCN